jgi:exodeoxyribonuclease VII large subunit
MRHGFTLASDVTGLLAGTQGTLATADPELEAVAGSDIGAAAPAAALSVSALNESVKQAIQGAFPETVWVVGEITDFDKNKDRQHIFFTLVEKRGESIVAQVSIAMFERTAKALRTRLENLVDPMTLCDGIEIRALVRVDLYPRNGRYQLIVDDIDASFTMGKLALSREEILRELRDQDLLRRNADLPLPMPSLRIGVLASLDSDGWNDFLAELEGAGIGFSITAYNVRVQGDLLRRTMVKGLRYFAARRDEFDVLCIIRGGGSRTDLAWFDDREVALAAARHPLKILCGIGHQRDQSVLDLITHSEKTPTAVAAFLVQQVRQTSAVLADLTRCLIDSTRRVLHAEDRRLRGSAHNLRRLVQNRLVGERRDLHNTARRLVASTRHRLHGAQVSLIRRSEQVRNGVRLHLMVQRGHLRERTDRLLHAAGRRLDSARDRLATQAARQRLLDPTRVLKRGYALVRDAGGGILTGVAKLARSAAVEIQFRDGRARATIDDVDREPSRPVHDR